MTAQRGGRWASARTDEPVAVFPHDGEGLELAQDHFARTTPASGSGGVRGSR